MPSRLIPRAGLAIMLSAGIVVLAAAGGWTQTPAQPENTATQAKAKGKSKVDPKINAAFKNPNVREYIKRFESETRENYAHRHEIIAALELKAGMAVADVGAGTGFFTQLMAEKVGPKGKVYAVDISSHFLSHIAATARKKGYRQVVTILSDQNSTNLPANSVDLIFLSDVYHHFEKPDKTLASIHQALRPGGRLVVIEFDRVVGKSSAFVLKHVRAGQAVFKKEIESAGFVLIPTPNPPPLKENFFLRFEKAAAPRPTSAKAR